MSAWFDYTATLKILIFGLLLGAGLPALVAAGLPALIAVGVRLCTVDAGLGADGTVSRRHPALAVPSWAIFALVLAAVIVGVLFIARDFMGHHTGWYFLGKKPS